MAVHAQRATDPGAPALFRLLTFLLGLALLIPLRLLFGVQRPLTDLLDAVGAALGQLSVLLVLGALPIIFVALTAITVIALSGRMARAPGVPELVVSLLLGSFVLMSALVYATSTLLPPDAGPLFELMKLFVFPAGIVAAAAFYRFSFEYPSGLAEADGDASGTTAGPVQLARLVARSNGLVLLLARVGRPLVNKMRVAPGETGPSKVHSLVSRITRGRRSEDVQVFWLLIGVVALVPAVIALVDPLTALLPPGLRSSVRAGAGPALLVGVGTLAVARGVGHLIAPRPLWAQGNEWYDFLWLAESVTGAIVVIVLAELLIVGLQGASLLSEQAAFMLIIVGAWLFGMIVVTCLASSVAAASDWERAAPEALGMDTAFLDALTRHLRDSPELNIHSVLVVKDRRLAYEEYFSEGGLFRDQGKGSRLQEKMREEERRGIK